MRSTDWKVLRIRAGVTQHEAGLLIDVPSYIISKLECGRAILDPEKLVRLRAELERRKAQAE